MKRKASETSARHVGMPIRIYVNATAAAPDPTKIDRDSPQVVVGARIPSTFDDSAPKADGTLRRNSPPLAVLELAIRNAVPATSPPLNSMRVHAAAGHVVALGQAFQLGADDGKSARKPRAAGIRKRKS